MSEKKASTEIQPAEAAPLGTDSQRDVTSPLVLDEQISQILERKLSPFMEQITAEYSQSISVSRLPIPSASELQRLQDVDPTFPGQLLAMAKTEQEHSHTTERHVIDVNERSAKTSGFLRVGRCSDSPSVQSRSSLVLVPQFMVSLWLVAS